MSPPRDTEGTPGCGLPLPHLWKRAGSGLGTLGTRRGHGTFWQGGDTEDAQVGVGDREGTNVPAQRGHGGQQEGDLVLVLVPQESHLEKTQKKRDMRWERGGDTMAEVPLSPIVTPPWGQGTLESPQEGGDSTTAP